MTLQKQSRPTTIKLWLQEIQDEYETLHTDIENWSESQFYENDIVAKWRKKSFLNLKAWIHYGLG
jgi:arginyl-tRNA synthetase